MKKQLLKNKNKMKKTITIYVMLLFLGLSKTFAQTVCMNDTIIPIANMPSHFNDMRTVSYNGEVYMFGATNNTNQVDTTYKYNPITNTWSQLASIPTARGEIGAAEVNGIVYCIGGWSGSPSNLNEAYTISTNSWSTMANTPAALTSAYAVSLNNKVYVFGGTLGNTITHFYAYDPSNNTYATLSTPAQNRSMIRLVVYNNKIYAIGGSYYNGTYNVSDNFDEYDPISDTWTAKPSLPMPLKSVGATLYDNKIYVFAGALTVYNTPCANTLYAYDFVSNSWLTGNNLPFSRSCMDVTTVNNFVYLFGGAVGTTVYNESYKYFCLDYVCTQTIYDTVHIAVTDTLIINALLTGILPPNNTNTIKVFPNPSSDHIYIDCGNYLAMGGYQIRIDNSLAATVFTTLVTQQVYNINLSTWTGNGTYFVYIIDNIGNTIDVKKIILQ